MGTILLLHSTCCYKDTAQLTSEMENHSAFEKMNFVNVLTGGGICTYFPQLPNPTSELCESIRNETLGYLRRDRKNTFSLESFVPQRTEISPTLETADIGELTNVAYKGLNLWETVKASVASYLQWESLERRSKTVTDREMAFIRKFLLDAARYIDAADVIIERFSPTHCLVFSGNYYLERVFVERCRRRGVAPLAFESSTFANLRHISQTGVVGNENDWSTLGSDWIVCRRLSEAEDARLHAFMKSRFHGSDQIITQTPRQGNTLERLKIGSQSKIVLFLGQVPHDSVIVRETGIFNDMPAVIDSLIQLFENEFRDVVLILRLHPGGRMTSMRSDDLAERLSNRPLPGNVRLITGMQHNTYELMEHSDVAVTISSQAGLEFLSLHRRLLVLGHAYYSGKGITDDVNNLHDLGVKLREALSAPNLARETSDRINVFLYGLIFEYLVPFDRESGLFTATGYTMLANILSGRNRLFGLS